MELNDKIDELGRAFEEFKKANDDRLTEIKSKGYASKETEEKVDKLNSALTAIETKIEGITAAVNRSAKGVETQIDESKVKLAEYKNACAAYMRKGIELPQELKEFARKTMSVDSDEEGGFLVSPEMSSSIVEKVHESSPMRELATVQTISSDTFEILHDLERAGAAWVGEAQARPETSTPKFKKEMVPVHELYSFPFATQKLLDDAGVNVEAWLAGKVSLEFGLKEATAFISGDGVAKPKGILAYADGDGFGLVQRKETATALTIKGDDLIDAQALLKEPYQANATWLINRLIVAEIRKLKGTGDANYLWQPGLGQGVPASLLGRPVRYANDLGATLSAGDKIIYGDFRAGYIIVDRIGIRVLRDAISNKPYVGFFTTKRVGGSVLDFSALKVLKVKA